LCAPTTALESLRVNIRCSWVFRERTEHRGKSFPNNVVFKERLLPARVIFRSRRSLQRYTRRTAPPTVLVIFTIFRYRFFPFFSYLLFVFRNVWKWFSVVLYCVVIINLLLVHYSRLHAAVSRLKISIFFTHSLI